MFRKRATKIAFVLVCLVILIMPHFSSVLAVLTSESQTAVLKISDVREEDHKYQIGDVPVFKIVTDDPVTNSIFENTWYCLNEIKSFPVPLVGQPYHTYSNKGDLNDTSDLDVQSLQFNTTRSANVSTWTTYHKYAINLFDIMYLKKQAPEQKTEYLNEFANYLAAKNGTTSEIELRKINDLITDDDIEVIQQRALWYFTNYNDFTGEENASAKFSEGLGSIKIFERQGLDFVEVPMEPTIQAAKFGIMGDLYTYLIEKAQNPTSEENRYAKLTAGNNCINESANSDILFGPFKVTAGEVPFTMVIKDQNGNAISRSNYNIYTKNSSQQYVLDNRDINAITGTEYYIGIPKTNTTITKLKYEFSNNKYETEYTLWKDNENSESNQPVALLIRKPVEPLEGEIDVIRMPEDLALVKEIVRINDSAIDRGLTVSNLDALKDGTVQTADYTFERKNALDVKVGDTVVYKLTVFNEGAADASGVKVYDTLPTGLDLKENSQINSENGWDTNPVGSPAVTQGNLSKTYVSNLLQNTTIEGLKSSDTVESFKGKSKSILIECIVNENINFGGTLRNVAEIATDNIADRDSHPGENPYTTDNSKDPSRYSKQEDDDDDEQITVKVNDLALQKYIIKLNNESITDRVPSINVDRLKAGRSTSADYTQKKDAIEVRKDDIIIYEIRVYNEGESTATGVHVYDTVPNELELITDETTEEGRLNKQFKWQVDQTGSKTTRYVSDAIATEDIIGFNRSSGTATTLSSNSKFVRIAFKVKDDFQAGLRLTNLAEISKPESEDFKDRDSQPHNNTYTNDLNTLPNSSDADKQDDDDYETVIMAAPELSEDLALVKYITKINGNRISNSREQNISAEPLKNNETTATYEYSKTPISVKPGDRITYEIRVFNEGESDVTGFTVYDTLPNGLDFATDSQVNTDNGWRADPKSSENNSKRYVSNKFANEPITGFNKISGTDGQLKSNSKIIEIECIVNENILVGASLKNVAEIATDNIDDRDSHPGENPFSREDRNPVDYTGREEDDDDYEEVIVQVDDLALRKYIVQIKSADGTKVSTGIIQNYPNVDASGLVRATNPDTTAAYKQSKTPQDVYAGDIITYEIRVYNEGEGDATGVVVYDTVPNELEVLSQEESEVNRTYGWEKISTGSKTTTYKSKQLEKINKFDKTNTNSLVNNSKFVKIECRVKSNLPIDTKLTNIAEVGDANILDRDSSKNNNTVTRSNDNETKNYTGNIDNKSELDDSDYYYRGQEDDDDFATVIVKIEPRFDLNLKKYATEINKKGITPSRIPSDSSINTDALVDESDSDADYPKNSTSVEVNVGDIVKYTIRVYNEGNVDGYANVVADFLPAGLGYLQSHTTNHDNAWSVKNSDSEVNTIKLSDIPNATKNVSLEDFVNERKLDDIEVITGKNGNELRIESNKLSYEFDRDHNLIKAFNKTTKKLDYKDIQVVCVVLEGATKENLKNISEIIDDADQNNVPVIDIDSTPDNKNTKPDEDDTDIETLTTREPEKFDLSLKKFITKVNNTSVTGREPKYVKDSNNNLTIKSADVSPLKVENNDVIIYTIRVYNEGNVDGYADEITDNLPKGLLFLPNHEINTKYGWKLYDKSGNEVQKVDQAVSIKTKYLSKTESEKRNEDNLLDAYKSGDSKFDYRDVQVAFLVDESVVGTNRTIKNIAEISNDTDKDGNNVTDIDSTPGNNKSGEDDIDDEEVYVKYFDLSLVKDLVKIIVTENGKTREISVAPGDSLRKVEIHRNKIKTTIVKFVYRITVKNEGEIAGYATEIKDYVPEGLVFDQADNSLWKSTSKGTIITTDALAKTLLKPGDTASVDVTLRWENSENNLGKKTNIAEISKDANDSNTPDRDSTPDNKVPTEDDYDTAEVFLAISTGKAPTYLALTFTVLAIMAVGIALIKKYVL